MQHRKTPDRSSDTASAEAEVTFKREETTLVAAFADSSSPTRPSQDFSVSERPGLKSTPMGSAVSNATDRYSLPEPALAVRNLIEGAQYAHLCTNMSQMHHRRAGYPFGMLVDFAADGAGHPIFCLSPLSIHSHNINEDPRCSLVVQMPGWLGLSNARVTIFGDVHELPDEMQAAAKQIFLDKHASGGSKARVISQSFRFYRMDRLQDIYFVGGFGTMQWVDTMRYTRETPDAIVLFHPHETLEVLTSRFGTALAQVFDDAAGVSGETGVGVDGGDERGDAAVISIDARGIDVRLRRRWECTMHRLPFDARVSTPAEAVRAVERSIRVLRGAGAGAGDESAES